jgi:hypothetical protein
MKLTKINREGNKAHPLMKWSKKYIYILLLLITLIAAIQANKKIKTKGYSGLWDFATTVLSNYRSSWSANPEILSIEIKDKDFKKLEKNRKQALERGVIINDLDGEYVPAEIKYNDKKVKVKLRLKGHMTDHIESENKWSFRIKVKEKDETIMGMRRFSVQQPGTRGYIYEWIYHELMKQEDVIALRYKFIRMEVNGEDWGIYAVEENFENELIDNNNRLKGPILRFNPDLYWVNRYNEYTRTQSVDEFASYYSANPEAYREDKVLDDSVQKQYYLKAIALVEGLRNRKISVEQAFDIPRLAKFHAIIDLVGGIHSIDWSDIKYYYNPVTAKLEPVAYESFTNLQSRDISAQYLFVQPDSSENYEEWHQMIFSSPLFFKEYVKNLERVSAPEYLNRFFDESNTELNSNLAIIYKEYPYKKFDKNDYYKRQKQIAHILNPPKAIHAYLNKVENNKLVVQIAPIDALPVEIHSIELDGKQYAPLTEIIMPAKAKGQALIYKEYQFEFNGVGLPKKWEDSLKINYSILGSSATMQAKVFPYPHTDSEFIAEEFKNKKSTVEEFLFIKINQLDKTIVVQEGKQVLNKDLIVPEGYTLLFKQGLELDMKNNSKIISYSPVIIIGTEEHPIKIYSSDESTQGIVIISNQKSMFKNVVFRNFAKVNDKQWKRSAAITFYESDIEMLNCDFYDFKSEDAVNMIRSKFLLNKILFSTMHDDALDVDFSEGKIDNIVFENCKENAIDVTKSNVSATAIFISDSRNKAINIKDGSFVFLSDITIKNSRIAIAAEDFSAINFKKVKISSCDYGIVAYKNKPAAGHAQVEGFGLTLLEVKEPYLQEKKSKIVIDNKKIEKEIDDVELIIKNEKKK